MGLVVETIPLSECTLKHEWDLGDFILLDVDIAHNRIKVDKKKRQSFLKETPIYMDTAYWTSPTGFYWRYDK
jgi:hypothetical protein